MHKGNGDAGPTRWQVREGEAGDPFDAPPEVPLLASAEAAGREWASSCRNGTCRTCMRRLRSGSVHYRIEWPGLLAEEKQQGWILPCVAHPVQDLMLEPAHVLPAT